MNRNKEKPFKSISDIFDHSLFRRHVEIVIEKLEKYLADDSVRGLRLIDPAVLLKQVRYIMESRNRDESQEEHIEPDEEKLGDIVDLYIKTGIQVYSPGSLGRQFSGVFPLAAVIDLVSSIVSQPSSFYEAAQLPNVAEKIMADEFNKFIGWEPENFSMVTTSGGSLANMTAILAARNDKFPRIWSEGFAGCVGKFRPALAVGDVHYGVFRAAGILGIGEDQIVRLPLNEKRQICHEKVIETLERAELRGLKVFCIVASAGNTSVGAFDPIEELAEIAGKKDIWFHIDGSHGASFLVSDNLRTKLKGIDKADSFSLDAHKMMFVPAMCTLLFYKNREKSSIAFSQQASYVFEEAPDIYSHFDSADKNFECTKRPLIMNLWVLWALYGKELFAEKIEYACKIAREAYDILENEPDFVTLHEPEANILCFCYLPPDYKKLALVDLQVAIRNRIKEEGKFFISKVKLDGKSALRVVFMNHLTDIGHFLSLLDEIRRVGTDIRKKSKKMILTPENEMVSSLIPAEELAPSSIDAVTQLPAFYEKIKECERHCKKVFSEIDLSVQDALVLRRLQQMTNTLMLNPVWRELIRKSGLKRAPCNFEEWQQLPVSDKADMVEFFGRDRPGLVVPLSYGGFEIVASGGTSGGLPVETVYSLRELQDTYKIAGDFMGRYQLRNYLDGHDPKWVITTLADYQMWSSGTMVGGVLQNIPGINYIGAGPVMKEVFQHILSYKGPKAFMAISQGIAILTELGVGLSEEARESFRVALYGSGLLLPRKQAELKAMYPNLVILSYFAATQAETIGLQLKPDSWLAAVPGLHLIEIVDDDGRWVEEGEEGELVVTRLHAHEAPFPRFKVGDRVIRCPNLEGPGLKTAQFEFAGRSGDVIHLADTQYPAPQVYEALTRKLQEAGVFDLKEIAHEIQFINNRQTKTLQFLVSVDNADYLFENMLQILGQKGIEAVFMESLIHSLSIFNRGEANAASLQKTGYCFLIKLVHPWSDEIYRTPLGKVPLLRDTL